MLLSVHALRRSGRAATPRAPRAKHLPLPMLIALVLAGAGIPALSAPASTAAVSCPSSLQARIDATSAGGTLTVPPCVYHESIQLRRSIILKAKGATIDGDNSRSTGVTVTGNDVTIDGLTVKRVKSGDHVGAINLQGGNRFTLRNAVVRDSSTVCLGLHGGAKAHITNTELTGCGKEGYFLNGMSDSLLDHNKIHHNNMDRAYDWFVEAGGGKTMASDGITFDANVVSYNRGPGIWFDEGATNATITRNKVHHNDREGIFFEVSSGAQIANNSVWNNGFGFATWGWGAGISASSSDGVTIAGNTVAWNARGISVISQARQLAPHQHNTIRNNIVISSDANRVVGWYDDHGGSLFDSANDNSGHDNRYWIGKPEPSDYRFEWNGGCRTLSCFNNTRGEDDATYLTANGRDNALAAAGITSTGGGSGTSPKPHAGDPRIAIDGSRLPAAGLAIRVSWSKVSGAHAYRLQVRRDGGQWRSVRLSRPRAHAARLVLDGGHHYRARFAVQGSSGKWSDWARSASFEPGRIQESSNSVDFPSGTWRRVPIAGASAGHVRSSRTSGATATFTFSGRSVAWVATRDRTRGSARVYVDGTYRTTVNLHARSLHTRSVVFRASWTSGGTHTVTIKSTGSDGHPTIDVDAFVVIR